MNNKLVISFIPPTPLPGVGYTVRYRPAGSGGAYTTYTTTVLTSPITINTLDPTILEYEGEILSNCGSGLLSVVATFGSNVFCNCATGYTALSDNSGCQKITAIPADVTSGGSSIALQHYAYEQYSYWGTIIYPYGSYGTDGSISVKPNTTLINNTSPLFTSKPSGEASVINSLWTNTTSGTATDGSTGRLNRTGVWKQADLNYEGDIGFSRQFIVPVTGRYFIGVGSDDYCTIKVNGVTIVQQDLTAVNTSFNTVYGATVSGSADLYRYWHVYEVNLDAGVNIISITGTNSSSRGLIGCEIYKATAAQLIAATTESALAPYIIFSSAASTFGSIDNGDLSDTGAYNCDAHSGYTLVYEGGSYLCKKIESKSCGQT